MTDLWEYLAVATVVALLALAVLVGLTRGRRSSSTILPPAEGSAAPPDQTRERRDDQHAAAPAVEDLDNVGGGVDVAVDPAEDLDLVVERPDSARGRLARLRARLARSNSAIGNALLALLSRGGLDEQADRKSVV